MNKQNENIQKTAPYFSFSFTGRIGRLEFANRFATYLILAIGIYLFYYFAIENGLFLLTEASDKSIDMTKTLGRIIFHVGFVVAVVLLNLRAAVMRLHDIGLSGWWSFLIFLLPYVIALGFINIPMTLNPTLYYTLFAIFASVAIIILLFPFVMPGDKLLNSYGIVPKQGKPFGIIALILFTLIEGYFVYKAITLQTISVTFLSNL